LTVLDTHAWVWWVAAPERLSKRARAVIEAAIGDRSLAVSSISVWEVHLLVARGRLALTMDAREWVSRSETLPYLRFVPLDNRIATLAVDLSPPLHDDPADRFIVATALTLGADLVTKDRRLLRYARVRAVW
jgi:PIN domain nuclease of toxin-antitoxin system